MIFTSKAKNANNLNIAPAQCFHWRVKTNDGRQWIDTKNINSTKKNKKINCYLIVRDTFVNPHHVLVKGTAKEKLVERNQEMHQANRVIKKMNSTEICYMLLTYGIKNGMPLQCHWSYKHQARRILNGVHIQIQDIKSCQKSEQYSLYEASEGPK